MLLAERRCGSMTGWLEKRAQQRYILSLQAAKIKESAFPLWKALWGAIGEVCAEYEQRYPSGIEPFDGIAKSVFSHEKVWVEVVQGPVTPGFPKHVKRSLTLILNQQTCKITCGSSEFCMAVGTNGDVCLKDTSGELTLDQVVEKIMDPFLFPDLRAEKSQSASA